MVKNWESFEQTTLGVPVRTEPTLFDLEIEGL